MLLALVILLGSVVTVLFLIWLTNRILLRQTAVPVKLVELGSGDGPRRHTAVPLNLIRACRNE